MRLICILDYKYWTTNTDRHNNFMKVYFLCQTLAIVNSHILIKDHGENLVWNSLNLSSSTFRCKTTYLLKKFRQKQRNTSQHTDILRRVNQFRSEVSASAASCDVHSQSSHAAKVNVVQTADDIAFSVSGCARYNDEMINQLKVYEKSYIYLGFIYLALKTG